MSSSVLGLAGLSCLQRGGSIVNSHFALCDSYEELVELLYGYWGHLLGIWFCGILWSSAVLGDFDASFCDVSCGFLLSAVGLCSLNVLQEAQICDSLGVN